jgi:HEPN domain-containing protein
MSMSSPADEAKRWLDLAAADLDLAVGIATRNDYKSHLGCYHAQQAVKKALKGALT